MHLKIWSGSNFMHPSRFILKQTCVWLSWTSFNPSNCNWFIANYKLLQSKVLMVYSAEANQPFSTCRQCPCALRCLWMISYVCEQVVQSWADEVVWFSSVDIKWNTCVLTFAVNTRCCFFSKSCKLINLLYKSKMYILQISYPFTTCKQMTL
jgi:hypothetical protein